MLCLACAMPGRPLCDPCVLSLARAPAQVVGGVGVEAGFRHVGAAARLIHNLKYRRSLPAGRLLAAAMISGLPSGATALVPVPRSFARRVSYGIDQALVLATEVGRMTGLPVISGLGAPLWWKRQAGADREHRHDIAFRRVKAVPPNAVLVDDVITTGTTVQSALRAMNASEISVLVATSAGTMESGTQPFLSLGGDVTQMRETTDYLSHAARAHFQAESVGSGDVLGARPIRSIEREETG